MEQPPHPMRLGNTDADYYIGAANAANAANQVTEERP
jgi:hypothetical protein